MKSSIKHALCLSVVIAFAVGCGKDKAGGNSSGGSYTYSSGVLAPGATNTQALAYLEELRTWASSNVNSDKLIKSQTYGTRSLGFSKASFTQSTSSSNNCQPIKVFGFSLGQICGSVSTSGSTPSPDAGSVIAYCTAYTGSSVLVSQVGSLADCQNLQTTSGTVYTVNSNAALEKVLSLNSGAWVVYDIQKSAGIYTLALGPSTFGGSASHYFRIDTTIHPVYNPVYEEAVSTSSTRKSIQIYQVRYN